jgi:hypothetical protein
MTRVGVTGHRHLLVTDALVQAIDAAITRIATGYPGPLTFVSALAEGADQLVVRRAIALGHTRLVVPMPLDEAAYLATFDSVSGREQFAELRAGATELAHLAGQNTADDAYAALGEWLLHHCDVLIAIWDGAPARGVGGTAAIVAAARGRRTPIEWVPAVRA